MGKLVKDFFGGNLFKGDKGVWMIYFFLCMISLVEVYSASSRLTFEGGHHWAPMVSQAGFLLFGLVVILLVHRIPCKWFMLFPFVLFPLALVLLGMALAGGGEINGTNRWLSVGSVSFQPSEIAKAALLMTVAMVLAKSQAEKDEIVKGKRRKVVGAIKGSIWRPAITVLLLSGVICFLILLDNVSTALMLFFVVIVMMFLGQVPNKVMFRSLLVIIAGVSFLVMMVMVLPDSVLLQSPLKRAVTVKHRIERKIGLDHDEKKANTNKSTIQILLDDENSQSTYASIAIANSDVIGLGPGNSIQRDFLQHAESDFIYAIIVEEMGIGGAFIVAFLYLVLLIRVGRIAQKCTSFFPAYLVMGFGMMMVLQAFVNMSVAVGLAPVTGQTLPLISKGGTSILITSFYIGVILSVSRYAEKKEQNAPLVAAVPNGETSEYYTDGAMS